MPIVARILLPPKASHDGIGDPADYSIAESFVGVEPRQLDEAHARARKERGNPVVEKMFKPWSPTVPPQVLERGDNARGRERVALGWDARQRVESDRKLGIRDVEIANLVRPLRRQG